MCQVISNVGFAKSGNLEKYLVLRATWQIGFGPKSDWFSYACVRAVRWIRSRVHFVSYLATLRDWRKPKKAELFPDSHSSRTGNSNRQFHRRHSLLGTLPIPFSLSAIAQRGEIADRLWFLR